MTLSILIPTYNYNARALVEALYQRMQRENIDGEIIVGDDASTCETEWYAEVESLPCVHLIHAQQNMGRAYMCNLLASNAQGTWLLIVDADAAVPEEFSLSRYLDVSDVEAVVCGGLYHPSINPHPEATLRYKYERAADKKRSARERMRHPHRQLSTFNLLVRRDVFMEIRFDERCTEYGYEDALFGIQLGNHGIPILHIDNPLVHTGLDSNAEFLKKTETALHTLQRIAHIMPRDFGLLAAVHQLQRWHLTWVIRFFYRLFRKPIRANLLSQHPLLPLFQLYKLGYYVCIQC